MDLLEQILRERKIQGISWEKLAEGLNIKGASLRIAFSRESVDDYYLELLAKKLGIAQTEQIVQESEPIYNTNGNEFKELSDGSFDVRVKLLPFPAYGSYLENMETGTEDDMDRDLETVVFNVDKFGRGNYMAFIVKNDSMDGGKINDTPDGAKILGRELQRHHWLDGFRESKYGWVIMCKQNIYHKDISGFDKETGEITCSSRNPSLEYTSDFSLNLNDVYKIFKVIKRIF